MPRDLFVCAACSHPLTERVERVVALPERRYADEDQVSYRPTMPAGTWTIDPAPRLLLPNPESEASTGCLVVNPEDGLALEPHPEAIRNSGCCGHDGCDGPNRRCPQCHADVATLSDDCWTYVELRFEPSAVRVIPAE